MQTPEEAKSVRNEISKSLVTRDGSALVATESANNALSFFENFNGLPAIRRHHPTTNTYNPAGDVQPKRTLQLATTSLHVLLRKRLDVVDVNLNAAIGVSNLQFL